jgi:hypothetical protein
MTPSSKEDNPLPEMDVINTPVSQSLDNTSQLDDVDKEVEENYMSGVKLYILIFGLSLAVFLMALDLTILNVAIPLITENFHSTADIGWYVSGYLLTMCSFTPLGGKLYSNFSLKVRSPMTLQLIRHEMLT